MDPWCVLRITSERKQLPSRGLALNFQVVPLLLSGSSLTEARDFCESTPMLRQCCVPTGTSAFPSLCHWDCAASVSHLFSAFIWAPIPQRPLSLALEPWDHREDQPPGPQCSVGKPQIVLCIHLHMCLSLGRVTVHQSVILQWWSPRLGECKPSVLDFPTPLSVIFYEIKWPVHSSHISCSPVLPSVSVWQQVACWGHYPHPSSQPLKPAVHL